MLLRFRSPFTVTVVAVLIRLFLAHPLPPPQHAAPLSYGQPRSPITNYRPTSDTDTAHVQNFQHGGKPPISRMGSVNPEMNVASVEEPAEKRSKSTEALDYSAQVCISKASFNS